MRELMVRWFRGDAAAIEFAEQLWDVMQRWDDVLDEGAVDKANDVFQWLGFGMNYLPFFARYETLLRPAMLLAYLGWRDANELELSGDPADDEKAFMLRAGIYDVYALMAWIIGGETHSRAVGPEIRRAYAERLATFKGTPDA